jgi:hypothetical protein
MIFDKAVGPLKREVEKITGRSSDLTPHHISPY